MSERIMRNWWIPGAIALMGAGVVFAFMSHARRIDEGWDPSLLDTAVTVVTAGLLFAALPAVALSVRRAHRGWSFAMLVPAVVVCLSPLFWIADAVRAFGAFIILIPTAAIVTLVGALTELARASVAEGADPSATA